MSATDTLTITAQTKVADVLETVICSRCGGSGRMPFAVYGGVCFKCHGTGATYTKRGRAARAFYRSLIETPVEVIRPGERVHYQGFTAGTFSQPSAWLTVEAVTDCAARAAEAGSYSEALHACGSCSLADTVEAVERAAEAGATVLPDGRGEFGVFSGLRVEGTSKGGERFSLGTSKDSTILAALDPAVKVAILKTVVEYQDSLTKAGKPRKGTRWAE